MKALPSITLNPGERVKIETPRGLVWVHCFADNTVTVDPAPTLGSTAVTGPRVHGGTGSSPTLLIRERA